MNIKCYACGNDKHISEYGETEIRGNHYRNALGELDDRKKGAIDVFVCLNCGSLVTNLNGKIKPECKKITYAEVWDKMEERLIEQGVCERLEPLDSWDHSPQEKALIVLMQAIVDILNERY